MKTLAAAYAPAAYDRDRSRRELLDILATAQFWRMRLVEGTLLSFIVFFVAFAIAARA
jgi:hypothetical protein